MATLTSAVIEIVIGGTVIIYGEGSTPVITQQITQETTTTPSNKAVKEALDLKSDKIDSAGNKVVYAPDGKVSTDTLIEKSSLDYQSKGVNKLVRSQFVENKSLSNNTGAEVVNATAKISNYIDIASTDKKIYTNSDRQIVFYGASKNILLVINALPNTIPVLADREVDITGKGYKFARITIVNDLLNNVYFGIDDANISTGSISSYNVRYKDKKVSEVLDGINYQFGVDVIHPGNNMFTSTIFVAENERHNNTTGIVEASTGYSATTAIPADLTKGSKLAINTNQTIVFSNAAKQIVYIETALSSTPEQTERILTIKQDGIKHFAFTFLTAWGRNTMYAKFMTEELILSGISAHNITHGTQRLDDILSGLSAFDKGSDYSVKNQIDFIEEQGIVGLNGLVNSAVASGVIARSREALQKNSIYYVEFKDMISGQINASLGGIPLIMAGRKTMCFRTDNRENQNLVLWVKGDQTVSGVPVLFDLRGKYKAYRLEEPAMVNSFMKLPSVSNDLSQFPTAEIPEPLWVIWNIYGNYNDLTATSDYNSEPCIIEYLDSNGYYFQKYAVIGGQGRTSMTFENHNSKYKLTNQDGSKFVLKIGDWLPRSTFHFKVNFSDFAQLNNPATASFLTDWYRDTSDPKFFYPWNKEISVDLSQVQLSRLYDKRPRGIIGAIPASIRTYWNHRSCGTMNMNAFAENFFLDAKNPLHRGFRGDLDYTAKDRWEEMCSDTEGAEMTAETWQPFYNWSKWMKDNSTTANLQVFKDGDGVKYDKQNLIDSWLFAELGFFRDNLWANQVWISYNSEKYYYMWYDMDTAFGYSPLGQVDYLPTDDFKPNGSDQYLWTQVKRAYPTELAARYKELRDSGRFSVEKFREIYGAYQARFNYEWFEMDFYTWKTRKSIQPGSFASLERILWFIENRLTFLDNKYGYTN